MSTILDRVGSYKYNTKQMMEVKPDYPKRKTSLRLISSHSPVTLLLWSVVLQILLTFISRVKDFKTLGIARPPRI